MTIELNRRFVQCRDDERSDPDLVAHFGRTSGTLGWEDLLKKRRVVLLAEAGRGAIVLDPFAGSGSTLIAAEKTGRHARCIEYGPKYCDVIVRRWQAYTGKAATFEGTDLTFEDFEGARATCPASRAATPLPPAGPAEGLPQ